MTHFIGTDRTIYSDVDDSLVLHGMGDDPNAIVVEHEGRSWSVVPHPQHIEELIKYKQMGHTVIVWSAGGASWSAAVVKALGLTPFVDACLSKPEKYIDDLHVTEFMPAANRVYMTPRWE